MEKILYLSDSIALLIEFAPDDPNTIYAASGELRENHGQL